MKKALVILVLLLGASMALYAAGGTGEQASAAGSAAAMSEPGQLPILKNPGSVTVSIFTGLGGRVDNFDDNDFTRYTEEQTGVNLDFVVSPAADAKSKLNLLLNSGSYPDVIFGQLNQGEMSLYGTQGILIPLDDINKKWGFYIKKVFDEYPKAYDVISGVDGKMYGVPDINDCYHCQWQGRLWMRWDWIQKVGMEPPETTDGFLKLLRAFKTQDPNGNGKADEVPLAGTSSGSSRLEQYFMNAFMPYTPSREYLKDGKFSVVYDKPEYREGLKYLNQLHTEGLLLKETYTIKESDLRQLGEYPDAVVLGSFTGWGPEAATLKSGPTGRWYEYFAYPALKGPAGVRHSSWVGPYNGIGVRAFITDKAKNPEVAFRLLDFYYKDDEVTMRWYMGRPGQEWEFTNTGVSLGGGTARIKELVTYGAQPMNVSYDQVGLAFRSSDFRLSFSAVGVDEMLKFIDTKDLSMSKRMAELPGYNEVMKFYNTKINYSPYKYADSYVVPPLIFDSKDFAEASDLKAQIITYVEEMQARFVTGDANLDTGWDTYLKDLKNLGLDRYLEINQKTYDAKYN